MRCFHQSSPSDVWLFHRSRYEPEWLEPIFELVRHRPWKSAPANGRSASPIFDVFHEPVYPRDPPQNDIEVFKSAATDSLCNQRYCGISHHNRSFEMDGEISTDDGNTSQNHRKTQHFIRGKIPGGSDDNSLIYGEKTSFPNGVSERANETRKEGGGFLYGTSAIKRFEKKHPARRPNNKLKLEEMTDNQRTKHQKLATDQDNYLSRYYEKRVRQKAEMANEKRKDFEMLIEYNPWGKPGGGAPRGYRNNSEVDANVTKRVRKLKQENPSHTRVGGGGSPNRTTSGTVVTSLKLDPEIRFQAVQYNTDIDPRLRYKPDQSYGKELDALVQESINRKTLEKRKNLQEEIRQIESNPFGNQEATRIRKKDALQQTSLSEGNMYDPWGKGYGGIPERKGNGKIVKNLQGLNTEVKVQHWEGYGTSANDFCDATQKGNIKPKKKETLCKNTYGQVLVRDFSPKKSAYNPWGRPGAGAPLKDEHGNVMTNTTGRLTNNNMEGSAQLKQNTVRKKEYLKTLEKQRHETEALREEERTNYNKPEKVHDVTNWLRQGKVGQPNYDSETKEIRANPKGTSDVTREKFQIRRLKNDNSKSYYEDLQEMADQRNKRRQIERTKERELSFDHVKTMNNFWGRPGGGAPILKEQSLFSHKRSERFPTNSSMFR